MLLSQIANTFWREKLRGSGKAWGGLRAVYGCLNYTLVIQECWFHAGNKTSEAVRKSQQKE